MKQTLLLPIIFALFIIPCLSQTKIPPKKSHPQLLITIERSFFGPGNTGRIYGDGTVVYDNKSIGIGLKGKWHYRIPKEKVSELIEEFKKINYFSLKDAYYSGVDGGGTTITSVLVDGKRKEISNDIEGGPEALYELEYKIDAVAGFTKFFNIRYRTLSFFSYLSKQPTAKGVIVNHGTKGKTAKREAEIKAIRMAEFDTSSVEFIRYVGNDIKTVFRVVNGEKIINF